MHVLNMAQYHYLVSILGDFTSSKADNVNLLQSQADNKRPQGSPKRDDLVKLASL